jgi:hypothetical protein
MVRKRRGRKREEAQMGRLLVVTPLAANLSMLDY